MKLVKALICTMMIALFLVAGTAFQGNQAMAAGKEAKEVEIYGAVQNSPNGFIIMSEGKQYRIEGQDLSSMKEMGRSDEETVKALEMYSKEENELRLPANAFKEITGQ